MELRDRFKMFTGKQENFDFIDEILNMAKTKILNFCHISELPKELEDMQFDIAVRIYNRIGREGAKSFSEGGQSTAFEDLIDDTMKKELYGYRDFA